MNRYEKKSKPMHWRAFAPPQGTRLPSSRSRPSSGVPLVPAGVPPGTSEFLCGVAYNSLVKEHLVDSDVGSLLNRCSLAYQHMLQSTRELGFPNPLRTSFACAILDRLLACQALRDPSGIIQTVKGDIFASLYFNTTPDLFLPCPATELDASLHRFKAYTLYFKEHEVAVEERDELLHEMQTKRQTNTKELALMERIIHRWQTMMLDRLFGAWRNFVRRRGLWRARIEEGHNSRSRRRLLRSSFAAWKTLTSSSLVQQQLDHAAAKSSEQLASEEGLLREYAKLVAGIEKLKAEKATLQDTVQQCNDDIASLKLTVEQLQGRLEQQRSTGIAWKEVAVDLCRLVSRKLPAAAATASPVEAPDSTLLHSLSGVSSNSVDRTNLLFTNPLSEGESGVLGFSAGHDVGIESSSNSDDIPGWERPLLDWVNATRPALSHSKSVVRSSELVLAPPNQFAKSRSHMRVVNFDRDFADGSVLLDLAEALGAAPASEVKRNRAELSKPERVTSIIRFSLDALCSWSLFQCPSLIDPFDVAAAKSAPAIRLLVAHLISRSPQYRCPLCDGDETYDAVNRRHSLSSRDEGISTISEVRVRVREAQEYHQAKRCEAHESVDKAWCNMYSRDRRSTDNELKFIIQEVMGKECVTPLALDTLRLVSRSVSDALQATFALVAVPNPPSISIPQCHSIIQWIKGVLKFPVRRITSDLILSLASQSSQVGVVDRPSWDQVVMYLALSNAFAAAKQSQQEALASLHSETLAITNSIQLNTDVVARHEFLSLFASDGVQAALQAATSLLAKMWVGNLAASPDTIAVDRFIAILKASGRVFTKSFGIDEVKRVFAFVTLEPNATMTFNEFERAVLCLSLVRDSHPWQSSTAKLKAFLSKELAPQIPPARGKPAKQ